MTTTHTTTEQRYGVLNAHMFGATTEPGEHVDWTRPDEFTLDTFAELGLGDPAEFAESSPHMIVFELEPAVELCDSCQKRAGGHGHFGLYCEPCSDLPLGHVAP